MAAVDHVDVLTGGGDATGAVEQPSGVVGQLRAYAQPAEAVLPGGPGNQLQQPATDPATGVSGQDGDPGELEMRPVDLPGRGETDHTGPHSGDEHPPARLPHPVPQRGR